MLAGGEEDSSPLFILEFIDASFFFPGQSKNEVNEDGVFETEEEKFPVMTLEGFRHIPLIPQDHAEERMSFLLALKLHPLIYIPVFFFHNLTISEVFY